MTNARSSGRRRAALGSLAGAGHVVTPDTVSDGVVAEVVRLYRDEGRSMVAVGLVFGRGPDWVRARLVAAGCPIRPGGGAPVSGADLDELARWRVEEGLTIAEVAARAGRPAATVADQLRKAGVLVERRRRPSELDPAALRKLYVDEQRTLSQVARLLGCSDDRARAGLLAAGVELRPPRQPRGRPPLPALHKEQLRELYVGRGLSAAEIAAQVGGGTTRVTAALNRYGIPLRPASRRRVPRLDVDLATLTDLYVSLRLDDTEIGARFGVPAWRVKARRLQLGVARPLVPPPHPGPPPAPPADELRLLYLDQGMPTERIARHYRTAAPVVRR
ncbi:MAG: hypothetical protein ACR2JO_01345 [Mycobacteriales bacterium]